jgi:hypothetical protein
MLFSLAALLPEKKNPGSTVNTLGIGMIKDFFFT